ncbi:SMC-Scp complex subunit ScpB [Alteribacillus iranensis]|uniref:Segregation and condensation protein B n=1 Tax=Alteribacillus iranensis TaxID=930128 RepID=A0A1I1ZLT7_9BACI|nr:SMC-Scp complex subunit ScpB [Alteribacillus iranensis]SFE32649.1 condensin subunit ScpB [Alteribacillus iranensis]
MSQNIHAIILGMLYVRGQEGLLLKETAELLDITVEEAEHQLETCKEYTDLYVPGLQIIRIEDTYRLVTKDEIAPYIQKLMRPASKGKLSQAALETLAIVAYNQPVSRTEIEEIRGVKSEAALSTLVNKEFIQEAGRAASIGRPILYKTTERFLEHFHLSSLEDLPDLEDVTSEEEDGSHGEEAELFFQSINNQL